MLLLQYIAIYTVPTVKWDCANILVPFYNENPTYTEVTLLKFDKEGTNKQKKSYFSTTLPIFFRIAVNESILIWDNP